ncbi:MAG: hypothetical protein ACK5RV_12705 [Flavobacterium sp.]|jgi:hypothetical protein|uniref:hypothetical protein n=1 Tax=Flavobacterium sp. TaxID=239 RepID=UPI0022CC0AF0|nr:hypothetical protein [Flavobacterium sp.]MCZ8168197.1 hypothetical protein [Flavobacterium sp.]MCZ8297248.1 hypothetical protein [Flavobacterium sp.]
MKNKEIIESILNLLKNQPTDNAYEIVVEIKNQLIKNSIVIENPKFKPEKDRIS